MRASQRPEGYKADLLAHGKVVGDFLEISSADYMVMRTKYSPFPSNFVTSSCCGKNASFPPLMQQAKNAASAVGRAVGAVIHKEKVLVVDEVLRQREATCDGCEFKKDSRCLKCGCMWKVKIRLATEKCPVGKW